MKQNKRLTIHLRYVLTYELEHCTDPLCVIDVFDQSSLRIVFSLRVVFPACFDVSTCSGSILRETLRIPFESSPFESSIDPLLMYSHQPNVPLCMIESA